MKNVIPVITHESGRYWEQPDRSSLLVDDTHALMDKAAFEKLHDYSTSFPSGVYDGKMWKRWDPIYKAMWDGEGMHRKRYLVLTKEEERTWYLCWYGPSENPNQCSVNYRKIILV
jgi:hypothetical protein